MSDIKHEACKSCGAPVMYIVAAASGKVNILDRDPVEEGNACIINDQVVYARKAEPLPDDLPRYVSHFVTCSDATNMRAGLAARTKANDTAARNSWE